MNITFIPKRELNRIINSGIETFRKLQLISDVCRINTLSSIKKAGSGHVGSSLSSIDIFTYLYFYELNILKTGIKSPDRDIFFSSKGHDCPGLYSVLAAAGILDFSLLSKLRKIDGLYGHPEVTIPSIETNTGSLGMGISKAKGFAFAKNLNKNSGRVFVLTGDGELQEGQIWESMQTTAHQGINNICAIVDHNKIQTDKPVKDIIDLGDLENKFRAFGWHVESVNGHDFQELAVKFNKLKEINDKPKILIANTIKGKGVSFMEGKAVLEDEHGIYKWHSGAPDDSSYEIAVKEIINKINNSLYDLGLEHISIEITDIPVAKSTTNERIVAAYSEALVECGRERKDIVVLDADLAADCGLRPFATEFPDRFIENGIAEQDMVSMAGGLALQEFLPIVNSFGVFLASRANEQIYNNATEDKKIIYVCHLAGLIPAGPGKSHQSVRDISLFGALPNCTIVEPCNSRETKNIVKWCINEAKETCMIRLAIGPSPRNIELPTNYNLTFAKGTVLGEGADAVLFSYGPIMLNEALFASELLSAKGISLKVVNMPWINRVDKEWLKNTVIDCKAIFVLDNHSTYGGLGDFLLNKLTEINVLTNKKFQKFGAENYPACGTPAEVLKYHQLNGESLALRISQACYATA